MAFAGGGSNGQWVRTRNPESAKVFLAEKQLEAEQAAARSAWLRELWHRGWCAVRRLFRGRPKRS